MGIEANEKADQSARQSSPCPLMVTQPALGISAKFAREVISGWTIKKHVEY